MKIYFSYYIDQTEMHKIAGHYYIHRQLQFDPFRSTNLFSKMDLPNIKEFFEKKFPSAILDITSTELSYGMGVRVRFNDSADEAFFITLVETGAFEELNLPHTEAIFGKL